QNPPSPPITEQQNPPSPPINELGTSAPPNPKPQTLPTFDLACHPFSPNISDVVSFAKKTGILNLRRTKDKA
ncbi:MAG: hypothetical protein ACLFWI_21475, partial [Coleofasciculus sp.]